MSTDGYEILASYGYKVQGFLGTGGFSKCYKVFSQKYKETFVCKIGTNKELYQNEINALIKLNHPNIIKMYDHFEGEGLYFLILEYCQKGTVDDLINPGKGMQLDTVFSLLAQLASALSYMRSKNMSHMDIKPSNFFIDNHGKLKLADFGLARSCDNTLIDKNNATYAFMAPEIILKQDFDPTKADMWALGVSIYYMAFGKLPWAKLLTHQEDILSAKYKLPQDCDPLLADIIQNTIVVDPAKRLSINSIKDLIGSKLSPQKPVKSSSFKKASITILKNNCLTLSKRVHKSYSPP